MEGAQIDHRAERAEWMPVTVPLTRPVRKLDAELVSRLRVFDEIAFVKIHLHDLPGDTCFDCHGVERRHVSEPIQVNRNGGTSNLLDHHRHRAKLRSTASTIFDSGLTDAHHHPRPGYVIVCAHLHAAHCKVKVSSQ